VLAAFSVIRYMPVLEPVPPADKLWGLRVMPSVRLDSARRRFSKFRPLLKQPRESIQFAVGPVSVVVGGCLDLADCSGDYVREFDLHRLLRIAARLWAQYYFIAFNHNLDRP